MGEARVVPSFARLQGAEPGFEPHNVLTGNLALPEVRHPTGPKQAAFYRTAIESIRQLPGVRYAAAVSVLLESTNFDTTGTQTEGTPRRWAKSHTWSATSSHRIISVRFQAPWRTIVGVVRDVLSIWTGCARSAQLYFPHAQFPGRYVTLVVKCASDRAQLAAGVRARVRTVAKDQPPCKTWGPWKKWGFTESSPIQ